jgi:uncharacterized membrane protein YoaT (DUF817 family)
MNKVVPLTSGFMLTSIIGFFVSAFYVLKLDITWGFTFCLFFVIMFIASIINLSHIEADDRYGMQELAVHEKGHYAKKKKQ